MSRVVLAGLAYGRPATLEIADATLTWRATHGMPPQAENVVTTIHEVRAARARTQRVAGSAAVLAAAGAVLLATGHVAVAIAIWVVAVVLAVRRCARPRHTLTLALRGDRELRLVLAPQSAHSARALAERIAATLASGEGPPAPPMLP